VGTILTRASRIEIGVAIVFIIGYLVVLPVALTTFCSAAKPYQPTLSSSLVSDHAASAAQQKNQPIENPESWGAKFWCEVNASDWFIGLFTLFLAIATYFLWRETERLAGGADDQSEKMGLSIAEAGRSATAMEGVSSAMAAQVENAVNLTRLQREFWQRQMRAYVSVVVGGATFQEREKRLKFAGRPKVINDGMTPAHNVKTVIKAAILKVPLPDDFDFSLPASSATAGPAIGPRQTRDYTGIVEEYVPDQDVKGIKDLTGQRGLVVWGRITYDDAFGQPHYANFAQALYWGEGEAVWGAYVDRHNDSD
jgi:hypothetical protein